MRLPAIRVAWLSLLATHVGRTAGFAFVFPPASVLTDSNAARCAAQMQYHGQPNQGHMQQGYGGEQQGYGGAQQGYHGAQQGEQYSATPSPLGYAAPRDGAACPQSA